MQMGDLILNKTYIEAVDDFNRLYGQKAISICPELYNITISAVYHDDSQHLSELNLNSNDAFAYYFSFEAPPKIAEIIINEEVLLYPSTCRRLLCLSRKLQDSRRCHRAYQ